MREFPVLQAQKSLEGAQETGPHANWPWVQPQRRAWPAVGAAAQHSAASLAAQVNRRGERSPVLFHNRTCSQPWPLRSLWQAPAPARRHAAGAGGRCARRPPAGALGSDAGCPGCLDDEAATASSLRAWPSLSPPSPPPPCRPQPGLWTPTSQRGVDFPSRVAPERLVYAGQGPPPPSPLVVERFQQVISQLFQQVCSRCPPWIGGQGGAAVPLAAALGRRVARALV